jgi:NADPH-dependent 2,4-dienoyl-CoA reductase/sulfur reductase-like enzyme
MSKRITDTGHIFDVLIAGGGPAGIAAAVAAAQAGARVGIVDDNPHIGGQIWRRDVIKGAAPQVKIWAERLRDAKVEFITSTTIVGREDKKLLAAESATGDRVLIGFSKLILATGARERFVPFPGWTLPGVMGAGGLQALVKSGMPIRGKSVVVAGSGPLLLAVASYLKRQEARVLLIAEQAETSRVASFAIRLLAQPAKLVQAFGLKRSLIGVPYNRGCWPVGVESVRDGLKVRLHCARKEWDVECDYVACGFGLIPNTELAQYLGAELFDGSVAVDEFQTTTVTDLFCAGEPTGIGGLEPSLVEGEIAGFAAVGLYDNARSLFSLREKHRNFSRLLEDTFALRSDLRNLPKSSTIICRCEDVTIERLQTYHNWREAKLMTRCGMGPCQGRVCGPAVEFLYGWRADSVRPPIFPARVGTLAREADGRC